MATVTRFALLTLVAQAAHAAHAHSDMVTSWVRDGLNGAPHQPVGRNFTCAGRVPQARYPRARVQHGQLEVAERHRHVGRRHHARARRRGRMLDHPFHNHPNCYEFLTVLKGTGAFGQIGGDGVVTGARS